MIRVIHQIRKSGIAYKEFMAMKIDSDEINGLHLVNKLEFKDDAGERVYIDSSTAEVRKNGEQLKLNARKKRPIEVKYTEKKTTRGGITSEDCIKFEGMNETEYDVLLVINPETMDMYNAANAAETLARTMRQKEQKEQRKRDKAQSDTVKKQLRDLGRD